jgi:hypothetical protein
MATLVTSDAPGWHGAHTRYHTLTATANTFRSKNQRNSSQWNAMYGALFPAWHPGMGIRASTGIIPQKCEN